MATTLPICNLCQIRKADKKNSHIIPKFLGKSLSINSNGKSTVYTIGDFQPDGRYEKKQDTPKEDYILCSKCEELINNRYERPFSNDFFYLKDDKSKYFRVVFRRELFEYRVYYYKNFDLFILFIYSIIYRVCISTVKGYASFTLPEEVLELIRRSILENEILFEIPLVVLTTHENLTPSSNLIFAINNYDGADIISANELIIILNYHKSESLNKFSEAAIKFDNMIRVISLPHLQWSIWNKAWIDIAAEIARKRIN